MKFNILRCLFENQESTCVYGVHNNNLKITFISLKVSIITEKH